MSAFRRVEGERAGPAAVGILVPPSRRTLVIVRPRALEWDLVPVRRTMDGRPGSSFLELGRPEAAVVAEQLAGALETNEGAAARVESVSSPESGFLIRATVGDFSLLLCARVPGQPYRPLVFPAHAAAEEAARRLVAVLCPEPDADQELYVNTLHFARD